jgi:O-antigen/teichoic acid export membrane protein
VIEPGAPMAQLGARAVSNTVFVLSARIVSRLTSLVVVLVMANALGDTQYGRYATMISFSALVSVVADFGFNP